MATKNGTTEVESPAPAIRLTPVRTRTINVQIAGTTELIMHAWSEKAKRLMRDAQQQPKGKVKTAREPKDPEAEFQAAFYRLPDGTPGMPAPAFKAAMVSACRYFDGLTMTAAKQCFFVVGEGQDQLVPIKGEVRMREDMPRNANGGTDLRYRPGFWPWSAILKIKYPVSLMDDDSVVSLVEAAGLCGVGDWRPSSPKSATGSYGMFEVAR